MAGNGIKGIIFEIDVDTSGYESKIGFLQK